MIRKEDSVIDFVRSQRHEISERFDHDIDRVIDYFIEMENKMVGVGRYNFIGRTSAKKRITQCSGERVKSAAN
jgi:hypothetical protein